MRLDHCFNTPQFRRLAKKRLPGPIFHYIDGAADDEVTYRRNTEAYETCDLVPNVLAGVETIDMSTTVMGMKLDLPIFLIEEIGDSIKTPKMFQLYYHKDKELTYGMIERCKDAGFDAIALTVDTIVGGNRERDLVTGFTSPPRLTPRSLASFALHPRWTLNYLLREPFELSNLKEYVAEGSNISISVSEYFSTMLDQSMDWAAAEEIRKRWGKHFCLKGIMSVEDAHRAVDIGATAIMISNHGGRQLDGSRSPFDQLAEIVDAVGDKIDVICDGGIQRGTHVLKALSLGAKACSGGRWYLYALAAAGQAGVEKALANMRTEIERDMKLMGARSVADLGRGNVRFR
jgi:L-lactate dehydrogenase (cytochrome)